MSYQDYPTQSGRECPGENETATPQVLFSKEEIRKKFFDEYEDRLVKIYTVYGMKTFRNAIDFTDMMLVHETEWNHRKTKIVLRIEKMEMEKKKQEQQCSADLEKMASLYEKLAAKPQAQNIIYNQPGTISNIGCEIKQSHFKVIPGGAGQLPQNTDNA